MCSVNNDDYDGFEILFESITICDYDDDDDDINDNNSNN